MWKFEVYEIDLLVREDTNQGELAVDGWRLMVGCCSEDAV
jgi:hypothetical protein